MATSSGDSDSRGEKRKQDTDENVKDVQFSFSETPTLNMLRETQQEFINARNWDQYHTPRNILLAMVAEVGELAELFQWKGECAEGLPDWTSKERTNLEHELSDVFVYLLRLSEKCRVDLPKVAAEKIELNKLKYPSDKVYGSSKKYNEYK